MKQSEQFNLELLLNILGSDLFKQKWFKNNKTIPENAPKPTPDPLE